MYKSKLFMSFALLFNIVCIASEVDQDTIPNRFCGPSKASKGLECVQDAICALTNKIDSLVCCEDLCAATVITEAGILTESGIYCLGNDVQGTIIITGSSITLNLNGHTISAGSDGIAVASTASDVRIRNGFIQGSEADRGIFVNGATDVRIEDITCESWNTGIHVLNSFTVMLDHVACNKNCEDGVLFENSTAVVVRNSTFNGNTIGAEVLDRSVVEFVNCSALGLSTNLPTQRGVAHQPILELLGKKGALRACADSETFGFFCFDAAVIYRDCSAFNCVIGFLIEEGPIEAFNSIAQGNGTGFAIAGDNNTLVNCISESNFEVGFVSIPDLGETIFRDCVAKNNSIYGFLESAVGTDSLRNMYLNCVACNNGINYSADIVAANNAPVTTAAAARGFDNIDCDLPEAGTCAAKMVSEPQTLTEPGIYCLTNDIFGTIVISGASITLDLNGYTIHSEPLRDGVGSAIVVQQSDDVRIKNGRVEGPYNANSGIFVSSSFNVRFEDLMCEGWVIGIEVEGTDEVTLDRVISSYNNYGIACNTVGGLVIRDSMFDYNVDNGIYLSGDSQAEIIRCTATGVQFVVPTDVVVFAQTGFHIVENARAVFRDCSASGYVIGFSIECASHVDIYNCVANDTFEGFVLGGARVCVTNSTANNNFVGFFMPVNCEGGFVTLRDCSATDNGAYGFLDATVPTDTSVNMYLNCVACNNGTNYSPNIIASNNAPVTSAANARGFDNVDCSDTTPDLLAAVIQLLLGTVTDLP